MRIALGVLRIPARDFWAMTPRELEALFCGAFSHSTITDPPSRTALAALIDRFPDSR